MTRSFPGTFVLAALVAVAGLGSWSVACANRGLRLEELPTEPIAALYWDDADARSRKKIQQGEREQASGRPRLGVARLESLRDMIQGGTLHPGLSQYPGRLVLIDPRSGDFEVVSAAPPGAQPLAWKRDRSALLFSAVRREPGQFELFEYRPASGDVVPVVAGPGRGHPRGDFGPGRSLVYTAFSLRSEPDPAVWVRRRGRPARAIAHLLADTVRWSPSEPVLVVGERSTDPRLRMARSFRILRFDAHADAPGEGRALGPGRHPSFSPDGEWIVYSAPMGNGWRLQRMRSDGSARSPVGRGVPARNEQMPTVSPDGRYVAFVADEAELTRLFVRRMDGTSERFLLSQGSVAHPVW